MSNKALSLRVGGLLLLTLIAYFPVMRYGGWIWDDDQYVTENPTLHTTEGLGQIWANSAPEYNKQYYPLVHTSFWLDYHAWSLNPTPYHVENVLLHALNAVLVWIILRKLAVPGAWLIAAIFAVHPLEVESVAWVTERKNVLSGAFYLLALLAYWRFVVGGNGEDRDAASPMGGRFAGRWGFYGISLLLFVCALLSKSVTCSLPVIIGLLVWWKNGRIRWRDVLPLVPYLVIGAALGWHTATMEKTNVGAHGAAWDIGSIERCLIAGRALWFYVGKLVWPSPLIFIYPRWDVSRAIWWQYLFPLGWLGVLAILFSLRKRIGRGPLTAVLYFSITLFPALGFVNTYPMMFSFVADHFQYLAGIGIIAVLIGSAAVAARHFKQQRIAAYGGGAVLIALMMLSFTQGFIYHDLGTLWSDAYDKNPTSFIVCENLGTEYFKIKNYDRAIRLLTYAKDFNPSWIKGYMNLGIAYEETTGHEDDAVKIYEEGLRKSTDGNEANDVSNLWCAYGAALAHLGKQNEAAAAFDRAISLWPNNFVAQTDAGLLQFQQGDLVDAEAHWRKVMTDRPSYVPAHLGLGYLCMKQGKFAEAQAHFLMATLVEPGNPEYARRLALAWARGESVGEAIGMAQRACQMAGNSDPLCGLTLAFVDAKAGEFDDAVAAVEQAGKVESPDSKLKAEIDRSMKAYKAQQHYEPAGLDGDLPQPVAPGVR